MVTISLAEKHMKKLEDIQTAFFEKMGVALSRTTLIRKAIDDLELNI